jgi:putative FmdB family regulatory protein
MTLYQFYCALCDSESEENIPMDHRDDPLQCDCGNVKYRKLVFKGTVYSATHNGGMK